MQIQSGGAILFLSTSCGVELKVLVSNATLLFGANDWPMQRIEVWLINYLLVELVNARLDIPYYQVVSRMLAWIFRTTKWYREQEGVS